MCACKKKIKINSCLIVGSQSSRLVAGVSFPPNVYSYSSSVPLFCLSLSLSSSFTVVKLLTRNFVLANVKKTNNLFKIRNLAGSGGVNERKTKPAYCCFVVPSSTESRSDLSSTRARLCVPLVVWRIYITCARRNIWTHSSVTGFWL